MNVWGRSSLPALMKYLLLASIISLTGCNDDDETVIETPPPSSSSETAVHTIVIAKSTTSPISLTGNLNLQVTVTDSDGFAVADGTLVEFLTDLPGTSITERATTNNGRATATFDANFVSGIALITVKAESTEANTTVEILPAAAGAISTASVEPNAIGIVNSGYPITTIVTFQVNDVFGNTVADGTRVNFSLPTNTIGGASISESSNTTLNGEVKVIVTSGTHAGILSLNATVEGSALTTTASIPIWGGKGVANNFNIYYNYAEDSIADCGRIFTAVLGDIFGNPTAPGVPVTFFAESGTIAGVEVNSPTAPTDASGIAQSNYTPLLLDPGDVSRGVTGTGSKGWVTVLAIAPGQEPFIDRNENGVFDDGDTFTAGLHDYGEPFLDSNENGIYDSGEKYIDTDGNNAYSGPNGRHDDDTIIWVSRVHAVPTSPPGISTEFEIDPELIPESVVGEALAYNVTVEDENGNPPSCSATTYVATIQNTIVAETQCDPTGVIQSTVPFFGSTHNTLALADTPTVPVYVPSYVTTVRTGKTCGELEISVITGHHEVTQGGL